MSGKRSKRPISERGGLIDSAAATKALGVSRNTLYAYVSRGLVRSTAHPTLAKASLYVASDVEALIARKTRMRRPRAAAASALDFGLPVLKTRITHFEDNRLFYRSENAITFSTRATFEETAALLWGTGDLDPFERAVFDPRAIAGWLTVATTYAPATVTDRASMLLPMLVRQEAPSAGKPGVHAFAAAAQLVLAIVAAISQSATPVVAPVHLAIAKTWRRPKASDAIRRALVLLADHELNASTFAVRVVASTGAGLIHCALAGLAAMSGPLHGGATERVRAFLADVDAAGDAAAVVAARLQRGERIPGFGHSLYRDGDPRGMELLSMIKVDPAMTSTLDAVRSMAGVEPNVDFGLLALERSYDLPKGAALALFSMGRSIGWIAHAFEQRASGSLIRPRAEFVLE
ncbi:MAG: citrate synthase [Alphaproteobacteria bacterium]|nr:citrate synthase [Alphaproteobacteria bacterium]